VTYDVHKTDDPDFMKDVIELCWTRDPITKGKEEKYWKLVREDTYRYVRPPAFKFALMVGMKHREASEYFQKVHNTPNKKGKLVWVKVRDDVEFASGGILGVDVVV